ncbi:hypothetical protein VNI00_012325 [Paramarasmius palmivorus]|uniref:Uncharacterized protein n=1 Tax=Paramarasmius palmivorus TaxID=297713 RepID=A0AAW0C719_9AGAR
MAKTSTAHIDPDTGKPYRMCRKCGDSSPPHPMKHCTAYRRPVKSKPGQNTETDINSAIPLSSQIQAVDLNQDDPGNPTEVAVDPALETHTNNDRPSAAPEDNEIRTSTSSIPDSLIDPALRGPCNDNATSEDDNTTSEHPEPAETPTSLGTPSLEPLALFMPSLSSTPSSSIGTFSPNSTPSRSRRKRPTKSDPCYGEVVGVYRGNRVLTIRRTRQSTEEKLRAKRLKEGQTDSPDLGINVPKVFYDRTRSLVTQMHDLAEITGSWIHFSAQHPTASQPFIHYTSKRLRTEGGELLDNLHQANHELYQLLMTARRCDTTQLAAQLARASDKLAEVEADAQAKVAEATAAKEAAEKTASDLRAMLVAAGLPVPHVE